MLHDLGNALKHAVVHRLESPGSLRDWWITLESLINSYGQLTTQKMPEWIATHIRFADMDRDACKELWTLLGHKDEWVEFLCKIQPRWEENSFYVAADLEHDPECPQMVTVALVHIMKYATCSDSRFSGLNVAAKSLLGSCVCGLASMVRHVWRDIEQTQYYIKGFKHCTKDVMRATAVVACAGRITENLTRMLMKDDRVPKQLTAIDKQLQDDIAFVMHISTEALDIIASAASMTSRRLRDENISAAAIQYTFVLMRLRPARQPPFHLVQEDVGDALDKLRDGPRPVEDNTRKLYDLLHLGESRATAEEIVHLLGEAPWSVKRSEEIHQPMASFLKRHPEYGMAQAQTRATITQMRSLVTKRVTENRIDTLRGRLVRLRRKRPQHITGRQAFVRGLHHTAGSKKRALELGGGQIVSQKIIKGHGKRWRVMPVRQRLEFEHEALFLQDLAKKKTAAKIEEVECQLAKAMQEHRKSLEPGASPVTLSTCKFTSAQLQDLNNFFKDVPWSSADVKDRRSQATHALF